MPELDRKTMDALLRLAANRRAGEPLDLAALMSAGAAAEPILDALFELSARRMATAESRS